jgi:CxxC motif-containing protein (DUF1111 family)
MQSARPFLASSLLVCAAVAGTVVQSSAFGRQPQAGGAIEGLTRDERKLFRDGLATFSEEEDAGDGLGPIFNNTSCAVCHSAPAVGGSSPINETRAQRVDGAGSHFDLNGGSLFQSDAISPDCAEVLPRDPDVVIAMRQTTPLFGLGLVEAIPDGQIEDYAAEQARLYPQQAGRVNRITDVATGRGRVGRFGWKDQQATLLAFAGDAYLNEMGITSRLFRDENAPNGDSAKLNTCDKVHDPEDTDNDIVAFENFMRFLAPPAGNEDCARPGHRHAANPRSGRARAARGEQVFERVGCAVCHHAGFTAVSTFAALNGETVDAYSDFLLHDAGTGDGIEQAGAGANELRTAPLWGLKDSAPYLHDGSAATVRDAILRHANQGAAAQRAFRSLSFFDQRALLAFLDSL